MSDETWKPVAGWEGYYEVSSQGRVRSVEREVSTTSKAGAPCKRIIKPRVLKNRPHPGGYHYVSLCRNSIPENKYVHRMVLEAFVGDCPEGMECRHRNGNPKDNRIDNLHWGTHTDNIWDKDGHGTLKHGKEINFTKLTESQVVEIREKYATGVYRQQELAGQYGLTQSGVGLIVRGENWLRAGGPITRTGLGRYKRKER